MLYGALPVTGIGQLSEPHQNPGGPSPAGAATLAAAVPPPARTSARHAARASQGRLMMPPVDSRLLRLRRYRPPPGCRPRAAPVPGRSLGQPAGVDLVEIADCVPDAAAAGPLPHQGVAARPGDAAEELRAARAGGQAPAVRRVREVRGLRLVGPFVGVRDRG